MNTLLLSQVKDRSITYNFPHLGARRSNLDTAFVLESHIVKGGWLRMREGRKQRKGATSCMMKKVRVRKTCCLFSLRDPAYQAHWDEVLTRIITSFVGPVSLWDMKMSEFEVVDTSSTIHMLDPNRV